MHLRLACRMNVKNETARILRAHAASANAEGKKLFQILYIVSNGKIGLIFMLASANG